MQAMAINRRQFMKWGLAGSITPATSTSWALSKTFAHEAKLNLEANSLVSAYQQTDGHYGVASINISGSLDWKSELPSRIHDCVFHPFKQEVIAFSRRPGLFFWPLNVRTGQILKTIKAQTGRHFYGHGCFSVDGQRLFVTENDYETAAGVIGVYETTHYEKINEFSTYGVGPHDVVLTQNGQNLTVANGGIETHPSTGREKLNLPFMRSTVAVIDAQNGALKAIHELPPGLQRLSMRHLAQANSVIYFACQYEGGLEDQPPLIGSISDTGYLSIWPIEKAWSMALKNYVTSIAAGFNGSHLVTSSAKGGVALLWDIKSRRVVRSISLADCSGVAMSNSTMHLTNGHGDIFISDAISDSVADSINRAEGLHWDNHLATR